MTEIPERVMERVRRGAALLDEKIPDWRTRVKPEILDMGSDQVCVLGQLHDQSLIAGLQCLGIWDEDQYFIAHSYDHPAYRAGILTYEPKGYFREDWTEDDEIDADFALLTQAWRQLLTEG